MTNQILISRTKPRRPWYRTLCTTLGTVLGCLLIALLLVFLLGLAAHFAWFFLRAGWLSL